MSETGCGEGEISLAGAGAGCGGDLATSVTPPTLVGGVSANAVSSGASLTRTGGGISDSPERVDGAAAGPGEAGIVPWIAEGAAGVGDAGCGAMEGALAAGAGALSSIGGGEASSSGFDLRRP